MSWGLLLFPFSSQHLGVFVAPDGKCKYSGPSAQAYGEKIGVPFPDVSELKRLSEDKTQKSTVHTEKRNDKLSVVEVCKPVDAPAQVRSKIFNWVNLSFFKQVLPFCMVGSIGVRSM